MTDRYKQISVINKIDLIINICIRISLKSPTNTHIRFKAWASDTKSDNTSKNRIYGSSSGWGGHKR